MCRKQDGEGFHGSRPEKAQQGAATRPSFLRKGRGTRAPTSRWGGVKIAIPESQLETWSHQGSVAQSSDTYNTIKRVLEADGTPYAGKRVKVFLQGSYGNDTNIYAESDVDIVIKSNESFFYQLNDMQPAEQASFQAAYPRTASYGYGTFKNDVIR